MIISFDRETDMAEVFEHLSRKIDFSKYLHSPARLLDIINSFESKDITMIVENDYVDKQYRDSYYYHFSQKFDDFERNCVRLSFFIGFENSGGCSGWEIFKNLSTEDLEKLFIGTVVLRPLIVGNIGRTLLDPHKLNINGYVRTCKFDTTIYGKRLKVNAFPFCSQDSEVSVCAETALFNLLQYFGESYSQHRVYMPSEISQLVENETAVERVLPSDGLNDDAIARVLLKAHLSPRSYDYKKSDFDDILYAYAESAIPFILNIPCHSVIVVGHGKINDRKTRMKRSSNREKIDDVNYYYLNTSKLIDEYIIMDDNKTPYSLLSIDQLTAECYLKFCGDGNGQNGAENELKLLKNQKKIKKIKSEHNSMIVPLYHRIFIDAACAKKIFCNLFLKDARFIKHLRMTYSDDQKTWGGNRKNPFVWRMYLTTARSFKAFKMKNASNEGQREHYISMSLPHFIWVMEIGTVDTYRVGKARVEIVLDATSSEKSKTRGILSVGYKNHYVYVPEVFSDYSVYQQLLEEVKEKNKSENFGNLKWHFFQNAYISKIMDLLYSSNEAENETPLFDDSFVMFSESNLKEIKKR